MVPNYEEFSKIFKVPVNVSALVFIINKLWLEVGVGKWSKAVVEFFCLSFAGCWGWLHSLGKYCQVSGPLRSRKDKVGELLKFQTCHCLILRFY